MAPRAIGGLLSSALGAIDPAQWARLAEALERAPSPAVGEAAEVRERRIQQLYLPLAFWFARRAAAGARVIGLSGPQGCGKSTLVQQLVPLLAELGVRAATLSIDDFYLTREAQLALAAAHPGNTYLKHRGAPGTHDVALGVATLGGLRALTTDTSLRVPAYDKSAHGGRGDRASESAWPTVRGPLDLVLLEGWLLGFQPVAEKRIDDPALRVVNRLLTRYTVWDQRLDALVLLRTDDLESIVRWRVEAEAARAANGKPALDRGAAEDYIRRFLPLYALYVGGVVEGPWQGAQRLVVRIGEDRLPREKAGADPQKRSS